ncbi:hypothetical protein LOD99_13188 [Oopsacas minuta]|uniref:Uncharacterized protein n=1 Tax=Oopsacas minuta TaxID=111878 RepID=A0AAV7JB34_9METZ|nr:hypothetical protein LOD99_13188 [Oopsacas minuta]
MFKIYNLVFITCILFVFYSPNITEGLYSQGGDTNQLTELPNKLEKRSELGERNQTEPKDIPEEELERDVIISVLIVAFIIPVIFGGIMLLCRLRTCISKKRRVRKIQQQVEENVYNDSLMVIRKMGPVQLHNSFPQFINGIAREEMQCYMNRSAIIREYMNTSGMRNNPETGQIEGHEDSAPNTQPQIIPMPMIAIQYPSPVIGTSNNNYNSPSEEFNNNLYPQLPLNFKNGSPMFPMPKNSTPRSPTGVKMSPERRPSSRETPDRACHQKSLDLLKQITMSSPPNYYLVNKNRDSVGKSLPCLLHGHKNSPYTGLNVNISGAVTMKDRSASESDISN